MKKPDVPTILSGIKNRTARARKSNNDYISDDVSKPVIKTEVSPDAAPASSIKTTQST